MKTILASLAVVFALTACNASGTSSSAVPGAAPRETQDFLGGAPTAKVRIALFDAPLTNMPGVKVNVALAGVQLLTSTGALPFVSYNQPNVVNLIDLQHNALTFDGTAPAGPYTGVRLLIESAHSNVVIGNMTIPIVWGTPGHPTTAPVIAVDFNVAFAAGKLLNGNNAPTTITLDFNVMQSVRFANGSIYVQPSVTAANAAAQVRGLIKNAAGRAVANASVLATDLTGHVINVTATSSDGRFTLHALPAGAYTITVKNSYVTASGETITATGNDAGAAPSRLVVLSPEDQLELDSLVD
ncbi:MAG TPA: carboxypeptidase regulatory-like domain-containing protein [Xanthomonadales bacterium]|nr:carboxypeptidase regulatory-like domain-containing protein [Xanthomonadales bacterium]